MVKGDLIGEIVRLQVQRVPIKVKGFAYMPEHILPVDRASIDAGGMLGWHNDAWVVDAHNRAHPSRRGRGKRALSIGFTGHYEAMAVRFGKAPLGIAGENIIVDGGSLSIDDVGDGVIIETLRGDVRLDRPRVAAPCAEFTSFMLGLDGVARLLDIEGALADLHDGRRGFIVAADHQPNPIEVHLGNKVFLGVSRS